MTSPSSRSPRGSLHFAIKHAVIFNMLNSAFTVHKNAVAAMSTVSITMFIDEMIKIKRSQVSEKPRGDVGVGGWG